MAVMSNCKKCKKMFLQVNDPICTDCKKAEEAIFDLVKEYLRDHPRSTVGEVSEATGVSAKKIFGYLREGRIEIAEGGGLNCMQCGVPIKTGQLCQQCFTKASKQIAGMLGQNDAPLNPSDLHKGASAMRSRR